MVWYTMSTDRDDWSRFLDEDDDKVHEELYVMLVICYRDVEFNTGRRQGGDLGGIPGGILMDMYLEEQTLVETTEVIVVLVSTIKGCW